MMISRSLPHGRSICFTMAKMVLSAVLSCRGSPIANRSTRYTAPLTGKSPSRTQTGNSLVRTAKNLAAAFYIIHKYGYVIGDVNEGNILVTKKACVRLIDCDSFQVQTRDTIYHCEVGVAQFTPPELQKSKDFKMLRTRNHDNFGLAILIFLLLFMGRHPFSGVYKGTDDMPIERAIAEFRFAFGRSAALKAMSPPPNSVGLPMYPEKFPACLSRRSPNRASIPGGVQAQMTGGICLTHWKNGSKNAPPNPCIPIIPDLPPARGAASKTVPASCFF